MMVLAVHELLGSFLIPNLKAKKTFLLTVEHILDVFVEML